MFKKIATATALGGLVVAGSVGIAGATTTKGATHPAHARFTCAMAPAAEARIAKIDARIATGLPKLQQAETTATANGNTVRADRLAKRITRVERIQTRVNSIQSRIEAKCGTSTASQTG